MSVSRRSLAGFGRLVSARQLETVALDTPATLAMSVPFRPPTVSSSLMLLEMAVEGIVPFASRNECFIRLAFSLAIYGGEQAANQSLCRNYDDRQFCTFQLQTIFI